MKATIINSGAGPQPPRWSSPTTWEGSAVPMPGNGLHVVLNATSVMDLGINTDPFIVNDISAGLEPFPQLSVTGFLSAHDLNGVGQLRQADGGVVHVRHDIDGSTNILTLGRATSGGPGGVVEIEHGVGNARFGFSESASGAPPVGPFTHAAQDATLILDRPPGKSLDNSISLPPTFESSPFGGIRPLFSSLKIELGGLHFDHADFIPNTPGSFAGDIRLTNHGETVYDLTNVGHQTFGVLQGAFSVGTDPVTNYDYVAYRS